MELSQSPKDDHQVPTQTSDSCGGIVPSQNGEALTTQEEFMRAGEEEA